MKSKIDNSLEITNNTCGVVSLVRKRGHAILLIETLINNIYTMYKSHFLPKDKMPGFWDVIWNPINHGIVKKTIIIPYDIDEKEADKILYDNNELVKGACLSWKCTNKNILKLIQSIDQDVLDPPKFQLHGNTSSEVKTDNKGHNCMSWSLEKLTRIGINIGLTSWGEWMAIDPESYLPNPNKGGCCIS